MTLASDKLDGNGLLGLLKKADKTFECVRQDSYRAANAGQFMVDLVIALRDMQHTEPVTFSQSDLVAAEKSADNLERYRRVKLSSDPHPRH